jgi:competence protein ComEA
MPVKKLLLAAIAMLAFTSAAFARVNVNSATSAELEALNEIGPVKAKAIVEYRKKHGVFKSVDELTKVPGVGAATLQKIKGELSVSDAAKPSVAADKKPAVSAGSPAKTPAAKTPAAATTNK